MNVFKSFAYINAGKLYILIGFLKIGKKILNNWELKDENADFGHLAPSFACFWPVRSLVTMSKARNKYFCPSYV